jgi:DNA-binding transcriptional LysR family regulator
VELTVYGEKLLTRTTEAFDTLKQGLRDIEFYSDPGSGEVCVGADMSYIAGGFVAAIIERVSERYPRLAVQVIETTTSMATPEFRELRERKVDLVLGRISSPIVADDLCVESLFDEAIVVTTNTQNRWAGRSHVELAALRDEAWILAPAPNMARGLVESAFRRLNVDPPTPKVTTYSIHLRLQLLASGRYLTVLTEATVRYGAARWSLTRLPVDLGPRLPVVAVTLKHRTLPPSAELFIREARAATKAMRSLGEVGC